MSREAADSATVTSPIVVIAALGVERAGLERVRRRGGGAGIAFVQSGPGADRAGRAARQALDAGAAALLSWGLAGGLAQNLMPGAVVVPRAVIDASGAALAAEPHWHAALVAALAANRIVDQGPLLSVAAALETPAAKSAAAAATSAVAADMESFAIAAAAAAAGVPFAALRVIVDTLADSLPPRAERWIDARGERRFAPVVGAALHPAQWPSLWLLASRYRVARASLGSVAEWLLPTSFAVPAYAGAPRTG
jgi:adenosylhomocysteine nucleosidase